MSKHGNHRDAHQNPGTTTGRPDMIDSKAKSRTRSARPLVMGVVLAIVGICTAATPAFAIPPAVVSETAAASTPFEARLEATVNPNNQSSECEFEYGEAAVSEHEAPCETATVGGFGEQGVGVTVTGLAKATTYHYRVVLKTAKPETIEGPEQEFTTLPTAAPSVDGETVPVEYLTSKSAVLEAKINPNFEETTYVFEYGTSRGEVEAGAGTKVAGSAALPAVSGDQVASVETGEALTPGVTYFYRVVATNGTGTTDGATESFTTVGVPLVTSGTVEAVTRSTVTISAGSVNPLGAGTTYFYSYIDQARYEAGLAEDPGDPYAKGSSSLPEHLLEAGFGPQPGTVTTLSELEPGTTYHFALVARNAVGTAIGADATFTTLPPTPPTATTGGSSAVGAGSATVAGSVVPNGLETTWELQLEGEGGTFVPVRVGIIGAGGAAAAISVELSSLPAGATFRYRFVATNQDGTSYGTVQSFTTPGFPEALTPAVPIIGFPGFFTALNQQASKEAAEEAAGARGGRGTNTKPLTNAQKLAKALKQCRKKGRSDRKACERHARQKYGTKKKAKRSRQTTRSR